MEPIQTIITGFDARIPLERTQAFGRLAGAGPITSLHQNPGGASFPQNLPDAPPDFDLSSQLTETEQLKTPQIIISHTRNNMRLPGNSQPRSSGGANCKNDPSFAPPDFGAPPQPTQTRSLRTS